jgi:hypothetical protein
MGACESMAKPHPETIRQTTTGMNALKIFCFIILYLWMKFQASLEVISLGVRTGTRGRMIIRPYYSPTNLIHNQSGKAEASELLQLIYSAPKTDP